MSSTSRSPQSLKRERDEDDEDEISAYMSDGDGLADGGDDTESNFETRHQVSGRETSNSFSTPSRNRTTNSKAQSTPMSIASTRRAASPARSSTGSLSEAGTSTPIGLRPSPTTAFTALNGMVQPPKKRAKLTFAEKEEQRILKAVRDQERAEERTQRELEKKVKEEDKARRDAEKEAERKRKEAEREEKRLVKESERAEKEEKRLIKEAERAEKDKEKKSKDDEKRRKEEEKQRIEEEKKKKEKSQPKLNAFFKKPATLPNEGGRRKSASPTSGVALQSSSISTTKSPCKISDIIEYQKRFPPFFIQSGVRVAPFTQFGRDEDASKRLQDSIDSYIHSQQSQEKRRTFDPVALFNLPSYNFKPRGKTITPVRQIMSEILGNAKRPIDLTTDSQNIQIKNTRNLLRSVPYKILSFAEDVRPPYKGTYTSKPMSGIQRMARNPTRRDLPHINYDYDSEAEWEDDDGEDVDSDCNDEEEIADGGEDLEEFLDDAEAETLNARKLVMHGDLEPKCSELCWENQKRCGPDVKMYRYLMEVISEDSRHKTPIDPFATHYWDTPTHVGLMEPPRIPLNAIKLTSAGMNGPSNKSAKTLTDGKKVATQGSSIAQHAKKLVSVEYMPAFKEAVHGSELSKLGLIEVLNKQFSKIPKSTIKFTLEIIAKRVGTKEAEKRWTIIDEATN